MHASLAWMHSEPHKLLSVIMAACTQAWHGARIFAQRSRQLLPDVVLPLLPADYVCPLIGALQKHCIAQNAPRQAVDKQPREKNSC